MSPTDRRRGTQGGMGPVWRSDGQRFLVNTVVGDSDNAPIGMIVNWPALLKKD